MPSEISSPDHLHDERTVRVDFLKLSILSGPGCAFLFYFAVPSTFLDDTGAVVELDHRVRMVIAIAAWMAIWWITEAIPMAATALLPVTLFPVLGVTSLKAAAEPYAHPLIFLFLGGFLVSIALQKWGLHRRFAVSLLRRVGRDQARVVAGFMLVTAFLSMWLSNTATTLMMLPIALSVIGAQEQDSDFAKCLLLSLAYSASIGGMATLIGTPPNLFVAAYFTDVLGIEIGFVRWMAIGAPCVALLLPTAWLYLTRIHFSLSRNENNRVADIAGSGLVWAELDRGGRSTLLVFCALVFGWVIRPWIGELTIFGAVPFSRLSDTGVALLAALALFVIPVDLRRRRFVLDWPDTIEVPWGTLILIGGGLSLAATINVTGADQIMGMWISRMPLMPPIVMITLVVALVILLTELTSNIATTATLVPVLASSAPLLLLEPDMVIVVVALAASCAFMLPVATPPNAIIFATGRIRAPEMAAAGLAMNIFALVVISVVGYALIPLVLR